jgi:hypothetical protein
MSITFHISPDGNDRNPGTADAPLATLHQARQAVRERIASFKPGEEQDIDIHLATAGMVDAWVAKVADLTRIPVKNGATA